MKERKRGTRLHRQARHAEDQERAGANGVGPRIVQGYISLDKPAVRDANETMMKRIAMQNLASGK
jgi:hypothetical protein